jgi:hypothetical protein
MSDQLPASAGTVVVVTGTVVVVTGAVVVETDVVVDDRRGVVVAVEVFVAGELPQPAIAQDKATIITDARRRVVTPRGRPAKG